MILFLQQNKMRLPLSKVGEMIPSVSRSLTTNLDEPVYYLMCAKSL